MSFTSAQVTGSDGHSPQHDKDGRWQYWNKAQIYIGEAGLRKYVANVGDWVIDTTTHETFEVIALDPLSLIPTFKSVDNQDDTLGLLETNNADSFRVYLDTSVTPHILAVDVRFQVPGSMSSYVKIFRGGDTSAIGKVISFLFDTQGQYLTDQIPLELTQQNNVTNVTLKTVSVCHTREKLIDGERVTVVVFNDQGHVVDKKAMVIENTSFIRHISEGTRYISHISLESPFLSTANAHLLEYPINVPLQSFNMKGTVHYSDGSEVSLPVDGGKFRILGLERFVSTVPGQYFDLALAYALANNEVCYGAVSADGKYVTAPYQLMTTRQDGAYTVKLYVYPVWDTAQEQYTLRWFMMDLNRDVLFDVTPYVHINQNSDLFDPKGYNQLQNLSVRINLRDVSSGLKSYIHTQTVTILLRERGDSSDTRWTVAFEPQQVPFYGGDLFAKVEMINQNLWKVNVANDRANLTEWLEDVYKATKPLVDRRKEVDPPQPTHFVFVYGKSRTEYAISRWQEDLQVNGALVNTGTLQIEFIRKTSTGTLRLSIAGLAVMAA